MSKLNLQSGFTLLEALVAISILMVAVAAPITIAQKGLASAVYSKDQMVAAYLAQDAIEYIKNRRDEIALNNNYDWNDLRVFDNCLTTLHSEGCQIDTIKNSDNIEDDTDVFSASVPLKQNSDKFYQYVTGIDTKFTRQILITPETINGGFNKALVTVIVSWPTDNKLTVQTNIYNY